MDRLLKKTQDLQRNGADVEAFLNTEVDFDFISVSLSRINLRRGHLLGETEWTPPACLEPLSHETVIDIEVFRVKEKQPEIFTCNWIKRLSDQYSTASDSLLKKSVKKLMEAYRTLMKNVKREGEKLAVFLSMPFITVDKQPKLHLNSSCVALPSTSEEVTDRKQLRKNAEMTN